MDSYNFQRPHRGLDGLVPADRFFGSAPEVLQTLRARVAANSLELARNGIPKKPFYITGQVGGQPFSVHAEGERVIMRGANGREEVDLAAPPSPKAQEIPAPLCPDGSPDANAPDPDALMEGETEPDHSPVPQEPESEDGEDL